MYFEANLILMNSEHLFRWSMGFMAYALVRRELVELKGVFLSGATLERTYHEEEVLVAYVLQRIKLLVYRIKRI